MGFDGVVQGILDKAIDRVRVGLLADFERPTGEKVVTVVSRYGGYYGIEDDEGPTPYAVAAFEGFAV
ncbi:MAG: hypothetical protein C5B50_01030 [Verrucomicrobia bacterium]|nr:MAG: hypothetical protein C5B50_01030 [Verrucomicrobiota bacterium]